MILEPIVGLLPELRKKVRTFVCQKCYASFKVIC